MKVLLDTCVLAELHHPKGNKRVRKWFERTPSEGMFLSVLVLGEVAKGVALLKPGKKKQALSEWLDKLEGDFQDRIVPADQEITMLWGELSARARQSGRPLPVVDGLLSATAIQKGFRIATRNLEHFQLSGVQIINPWEE